MGTLIVLVLAAVAAWVVWKLVKNPDTNQDGVVDHKDVVEAAKEVVVEVKAEAVKAIDVAPAVVKKVRKGGRKKKKVE